MDTAEYASAGEANARGGGHVHCTGHEHHYGAASNARDPVCGMSVNRATSQHRFEYGGETFYFCSAGCCAKFAADPARYLKRTESPSEPPPAPEGTIYTCPMHPEVRQIGPGSCPICGMALEAGGKPGGRAKS